MFEGFKIYGPYLRKDGRKHVVLVDRVTKKKTTMSYPKFLYQKHYNILLTEDDTIDHVDRDFTNDSIENLVVRTLSEHVSLDNIRVKDKEVNCAWCGNLFKRRASELNHASNLGKAGPFCGKVCSGKYGTYVKNGGKKFEVQSLISVEDRVYYYLDK